MTSLIHSSKIPCRFQVATVLCAIAATAILVLAAEATTIHVPADAPTIQAGVDLAAFGDTVEVACGTYSAGAILKDGILVRSETGLPDCVTIDVTLGTAGFRAVDLPQGVVLAGFRITSPLPQIRGLYVFNSQITVRDTEIIGMGSGSCLDGPAMRIYSSTAALERCLIAENSTGYCKEFLPRGGGIYSHSSTLTMQECSVIDNMAHGHGGGLYLASSGTTLLDTHFALNRAEADGPTVGGAIAGGPLLIERCTFVENVGGYNGGAISGGGIITNSYFKGNAAAEGSALSGNIEVADCTFEENYGQGAVCNWPSLVTGCLFFHNRGYSVLNLGGSTVVENCTFVQNTFPDSGYVLFSYDGSPIVRNSLIAFSDMLGSVNCIAGSMVLECCDFYGNEGGDWVGCAAGQENMNGNISADPLFCNMAAGDYTLQANSPCAPSQSGVCGQIGSLGVGCGSVSVQSSFEQRSWGKIKDLYR